MKKFKDGDEYFLRHIVRAGVRKSAMTRCERDVTIVLLNLWLHHRNGPTKVIRPGRERVAKKSGSSVRTVASVMAKLRKAGVIKAVAYAKGGNNATRYTMDLIALMEFCGCVLPEAAPGELVRVPTENCTVQEPEIARLTHAAIAHGLKLTCEATKPKLHEVNYCGEAWPPYQDTDLDWEPVGGLPEEEKKSSQGQTFLLVVEGRS